MMNAISIVAESCMSCYAKQPSLHWLRDAAGDELMSHAHISTSLQPAGAAGIASS